LITLLINLAKNLEPSICGIPYNIKDTPRGKVSTQCSNKIGIILKSMK